MLRMLCRGCYAEVVMSRLLCGGIISRLLRGCWYVEVVMLTLLY